ncbi:hypothetical protein GGH95_004858, partial [Coemansia sp. RSA 1836]
QTTTHPKRSSSSKLCSAYTMASWTDGCSASGLSLSAACWSTASTRLSRRSAQKKSANCWRASRCSLACRAGRTTTRWPLDSSTSTPCASALHSSRNGAATESQRWRTARSLKPSGRSARRAAPRLFVTARSFSIACKRSSWRARRVRQSRSGRWCASRRRPQTRLTLSMPTASRCLLLASATSALACASFHDPTWLSRRPCWRSMRAPACSSAGRLASWSRSTSTRQASSTTFSSRTVGSRLLAVLPSTAPLPCSRQTPQAGTMQSIKTL